jgi:hypothetical protein
MTADPGDFGYCKLFTVICNLRSAVRGVSSTVKLSVSKTELGGSNPSAPARFDGIATGTTLDAEEMEVWQQRQHW